ncbi:agouti signaling protein 1 [Triplophysa dalaica]|uniref:agouti signaling protein 1 n=1 Tax=Triplophysa dalaica TaxID=1582913 RepID=UPI0024DF5E04|nr:agouti signaling protein 1 [Triplophysa dalaica]
MNPSLLLCCLVLCLACCVSVHTHMLMEDKQNSNQTTIREYLKNQTDTPPVLIVGLSKTPKKNKKSENKANKNKYISHVKKPPPPPNCVPLWGSCRGPSAVCCEPCAFCYCRLFKTVCYCRMGYPKC